MALATYLIDHCQDQLLSSCPQQLPQLLRFAWFPARRHSDPTRLLLLPCTHLAQAAFLPHALATESSPLHIIAAQSS